MTRVISYGSSGILARARLVVAAKRICLIVLCKAKMAKNRLKIAKKIGENFDYWPRIVIFLICWSNFLLAVFGEKLMHFQENGPIHLILCINVPS